MINVAKKKKDPFTKLGNIALGTARLGVTTAVGSTITGQAVGQLPAAQQAAFSPLQSTFPTIAGFGGLAATAGAGKVVLDTLPKSKNKKNKYY